MDVSGGSLYVWILSRGRGGRWGRFEGGDLMVLALVRDLLLSIVVVVQ